MLLTVLVAAGLLVPGDGAIAGGLNADVARHFSRRKQADDLKLAATAELEIREAPRELKVRLVEVINQDRRAAGLSSVEFSEELSTAADSHCREMLEGDYASHWNRDGWKPYLRYSHAGIRDATSENIQAIWSTEFRDEKAWEHPLSLAQYKLWDYLLEGHRGFMEEKPPDDGHRRSILGARHTHIGIGVAYDQRGLRLIELFGARYAELEALPARASLKDELTVRGRLLRPSDVLQGISIFYEPPPMPMSREELKATYSYGLPNENHMEWPRLAAGFYVDGTRGTITVKGRRFEVPLSFWKRKPGVYTVAVWIKVGNERAFVGATTSVIVEE